MNYAFGEKLSLEESRGIEFKEVRGNNPVGAIVNTADEYAVAFLNAEGGRILWGVRDSDRIVVGVSLDERQRDRLRKNVADKLNSIQPPIDPTQFEFKLHCVSLIETPCSLYVAELVVPAVHSAVPYYTAGHEMFVRLDGVKRRLTGPQLTAWIQRRLGGATPILARDPSIPSVAALLHRVRLGLSGQGLMPGHLARFFTLMNAPFDFRLDHYRTDAALLAWLNDAKLDWIAQVFGIRREWLDGEDEQVYRRWHFDKDPRLFWEVARPEGTTGSEVMPEAYFIRWGTGNEWAKEHSAVFVVLAIPLCQISDELTLYRYVSDFTPYPWNYPRSHIQLRAWARLLYGPGGYIIHGREMTHDKGETFGSNAQFLRNVIADGRLVRRLDWHPEDFALSEQESAVAKEAATLPQVLAFLSDHGLPTEVRQKLKK